MKFLLLEKIFLLIVLLLLNFSALHPQEIKEREAQKIFYQFEEGINSEAVDKFSNYFGNRNYLSLKNGTTSYYSASQSYYVIKDFLSIFHPISFKLTNIVIETPTPFASGILKYNSKGIRGTATVFISLQFSDNQWRISQITIN